MFEVGQGVFLARMKEVNPQVKIFPCLLRRENLASRRLSEELDVMMKGHSVSCYERDVIKKDIFSQKYPDIGSYYMHLFCRSEFRKRKRPSSSCTITYCDRNIIVCEIIPYLKGSRSVSDNLRYLIFYILDYLPKIFNCVSHLKGVILVLVGYQRI